MSDKLKRNRFRNLLDTVKQNDIESKKSFKEILKDLADSSSLHGIPRIAASRQITVKVLWCMLFIATCTVLGYQLTGLFRTYYSYPIQTTITLDFNSINFPAISVCNMNPVRKSKVNMSEELANLLDGSNENNESTSPSLSSTQPPVYYYDYYNYDNNDNDDYSSYNDWSDWSDPSLYIKSQLRSNKEKWDERVQLFRIVIKNKNMTQRREMGHQREDFIVSAYYAGSQENVTTFKSFTSSMYGNCYTMSSRRFVAWRSGPAHGIKITLNLETDEYVPRFSTGYGARLVLHEPGTYPLPFNEGIALSPGIETSVGLKMLRISRLGPPYGDCTPGKEFSKKYRRRYSVAACDHFCRISKAMEVCDCIPVDAPEDIELNKTALPVCNTTIMSVQLCLLQVDVNFNNGTYRCDCHGSCKEVLFEKTLSSSYWPTSEYGEVLLQDICERKSESQTETKLPDFCIEVSEDLYEKYRHNFVRILIYFEDLNYETITQEPMYEGIRFLSDIGGTMGLFLGASVLSLMEILQLLLEIVLHIRKKLKKNKTPTTTATTVQVIPKQSDLWNQH